MKHKILRVGDCRFRSRFNMHCKRETNDWRRKFASCPYRVTRKAGVCAFFEPRIYRLERMTTIFSVQEKREVWQNEVDEELFSRPLTVDNWVGLEEWLERK